ncbi:MAG: hypothetical protein Q4A65_03070 [Bacillota bacterium]|nr:hypothetical protein [Bacillota bacterium]
MKSTARRLHTILLAFIVSLSLTFAGVQTQTQAYAEDYDEPADGPAIEIVCKNYVYTPFYHDSNKSFTIVSDSSAEDWGTINKKWKYVITVTAVEAYDEWEPIPLTKADGDYTYTAKTRTITLKGAEILPKVTRLHPETIYFNVNINVKAVRIADGEILAEADAQTYASRDVVDYTFETDRSLIPGNSGTISHVGDVYVANSKHPDGAIFTYAVTGAESSDDKIVSITKDGSDWTYTALKTGAADITITYKTTTGKVKTYTFTINVVWDAYEVKIDDPEGYATLPAPYGDGLLLTAEVTHTTPELSEEITLDELPDDVSYEWTLTGGDTEHCSITDLGGGDISVVFDENAADWDIVDIRLDLSKDGNVICFDEYAVFCNYEYPTMGPQELDPMPQIGDTMTIPLVFGEYSLEHPEGIEIEPMNIWWHYDENAVRVDEDTWTITRLTGDETDIIVSAEWRGSEDIMKINTSYHLPYIPKDLSKYEVEIGDYKSSAFPKITVDNRTDRLTWDDLDITVTCGDVTLNPDKYMLKAYCCDRETGAKTEITSGDFALAYNEKDPDAGWCDFIIQAVPASGSPHQGATSDQAGFTLCDKYSLEKLVPEISFDRILMCDKEAIEV